MRKRIDKKGLSPVIATVLLVGIVVVIGLIIFMWFRGLTQEAVIKFDQNVQLVCNNVEFQASYTTSTGKLDISNIGNVPIFGLKAKISNLGSFETRDISEIAADNEWPETGLDQGGAASISIASEISGADTITLTPILLGTAQSGGQRSFTCNEALHGYSISV